MGTTNIHSEKGNWQTGKHSEIVFEGKASLCSGIRISCGDNGKIVFGDHCVFTGRSTIICGNNSSIFFGESTLMSWDCLVMNTDFHHIFSNGFSQPNIAPIKIGKHCWIGCRCTLLKGTVLHPDSVLAAGTIICKSIDAGNVLVGGVNQVLKRNISWEE